MRSLEVQLEEVIDVAVYAASSGQPPFNVVKTKAAQNIKQVFADAGYAKVTKTGYRDESGREYTQFTINYADGSGELARVPLPRVEDGTLYPLVWAKANGYMTGQEWYKRFYAELSNEDVYLGHENDVISTADVLKAAKRASGVNHD